MLILAREDAREVVHSVVVRCSRQAENIRSFRQGADDRRVKQPPALALSVYQLCMHGQAVLQRRRSKANHPGHLAFWKVVFA